MGFVGFPEFVTRFLAKENEDSKASPVLSNN